MVIDIRAMTHIARFEDYKHLWMPHKSKNLVLDRIARFKGRVVEKLGDDSLVGVFSAAVNAVRCAKDLQHELLARRKNNPGDQEWNISFRIGLGTGQPLTEDSGFFTKAIILARRLCLIAKDNEMLVSSFMSELCDLEDTSPLKALTQSEEMFINHLFELTETNLPNKNFNVDHLSRQLGVSRSQLYRKILSLTGRSPNDFISALRMTKALSLMKQNFGNVSEVALEVGYYNPSYFSKCFQKNYGCTPSEFIRIRTSA
jgi:AraC-like DNA-binding protein